MGVHLVADADYNCTTLPVDMESLLCLFFVLQVSLVVYAYLPSPVYIGHV